MTAVAKNKKKSHREFIKKAKEKHGIFFQQPNHHTSGRGCIKCGRNTCANKFNSEVK